MFRLLPVGCVAFLLAFQDITPALAQTRSFEYLHRMLPARSEPTFALVAGDVDGDGDADAMLGNFDGRDRLYLNDGNAFFTDASDQLPDGPGWTLAFALGDVDRDGDNDLVVASLGLLLYLNDGHGSFTNEPGYLPPASYSGALALMLEDVDGDQDLDLLVGNYYEQNQLYLNDGMGRFREATDQLPTHRDDTCDLALGDVDADGDQDMIVGNGGFYHGGEAQSRLYLNDGAGRFTDATERLPKYLGYTNAVALGDVDADDDLDVVLGEFYGGDRLYLNDGTGHYQHVAGGLPSGEYTLSLALGDVDGDGDHDLVSGNGDVYWACGMGEQARLYLNDGHHGHFADATTQLPQEGSVAWALALLDLDGDGDSDLLLGTVGQSLLYLNDGRGQFTNAMLPFIDDDGSMETYLGGLALGDVDGDQDLDVVVANQAEPSQLYLNDGAGHLTEAIGHLPDDPDRSTSVARCDVDGDGDLDLVFGNYAEQNRLFLNDGTGFFTDATAQLPPDLDDTTSLAVGDVDGDGDEDLVIGNAWGTSRNQDRLYLNDGSGHFTDATSRLPPSSDDTWAIVLGDVDGDDDLDLIKGNTFQDGLYLNEGGGFFADATGQLPPDSDYVFDLALGDVDGDRDLDIVVGNWGPNRLYLNDGRSFFMDASRRLPPGSADSNLALGDVDGDGDQDLVASQWQGSCAFWDRISLNDGTGKFSDLAAQPISPAHVGSGLVLGDIDGDGDMDFVTATRNLVLTNLTRQLAWRAIPRIGKPLQLDLYGPADAPWTLYVSTGDHGSLEKLGSGEPTRVVASGRLDSQGRATYTLEVPQAQDLIGRSWFWTANIEGVPTNTEITTFTDL